MPCRTLFMWVNEKETSDVPTWIGVTYVDVVVVKHGIWCEPFKRGRWMKRDKANMRMCWMDGDA